MYDEPSQVEGLLDPQACMLNLQAGLPPNAAGYKWPPVHRSDCQKGCDVRCTAPQIPQPCSACLIEVFGTCPFRNAAMWLVLLGSMLGRAEYSRLIDFQNRCLGAAKTCAMESWLAVVGRLGQRETAPCSQGPILRSIQRYGRISRRTNKKSSPETQAEHPEDRAKDPRHLYLSIDEASTHVGSRRFRSVSWLLHVPVDWQ